jgi:hypothetical protein
MLMNCRIWRMVLPDEDADEAEAIHIYEANEHEKGTQQLRNFPWRSQKLNKKSKD